MAKSIRVQRGRTLSVVSRRLAACLGVGIFAAFGLRTGAAEPTWSVRVGEPITITDSKGDCWVPAWTADGTVYTPSDDTSGFRGTKSFNIVFSRLEGNDATKLQGTTVNLMTDYGKQGEEGPDGCNWKSGGCYAVDGVIYYVVSRHLYGEKTGDPGMRQTAGNASIIKSTDEGKTWTRAVKENSERPMFPGRRFATPYFIEYGQDGQASVDNADHYVYAISNNGFWDNGDNQILGRVARAKIADLRGADWEFYKGGDGMEDSAWVTNMHKAKLLLDAPGKLGMTGAVFVPGLGRYLMIGWYYPAGGGMLPEASVRTIWDFYEAPKPWGPWTRFGSKAFQPQGYYCPVIFPKFITSDGRRLYAMTAGNWKDKKVYRLTIVPFELIGNE
jgi:hypothetical protein